MARHLTLTEHLSTEQIYAHYRAATDAVERTHWQVVWLKSQRWSTPEIAAATGYSPDWVRTLVHRYDDHAADGLRDRRHAHPGSAPLLDAEAQAELERLLEQEQAPDGGKWNGPKIARWIERKTGRAHVHDQRGWDYLVRLGFSAQTPRPRHAEADAAAQAAFKK